MDLIYFVVNFESVNIATSSVKSWCKTAVLIFIVIITSILPCGISFIVQQSFYNYRELGIKHKFITLLLRCPKIVSHFSFNNIICKLISTLFDLCTRNHSKYNDWPCESFVWNITNNTDLQWCLLRKPYDYNIHKERESDSNTNLRHG